MAHFTYFKSPEFLRVSLLLFINVVHSKWRQYVNEVVPAPYLDEVFHVPQVQAYWYGKWSQWDPKITTPPGLYGFSYLINSFRGYMDPTMKPTTDEWRYVNAVLLYMVLIVLYILVAVGKRTVVSDNVLQREFNIILFPLLFFFSALFYTDLFSVFTVVLAQTVWTAGLSTDGWKKFLFQTLHLVAGLLSLSARQTNIFWVAVYLGGLQAVATIKTKVGVEKLHDPPISQASFQDFSITSLSLVQSAIPILPRILLDLWPQICLLGSFAGFVTWNGGVVLGDKGNHIATIHLTQMLYIWPLIIFFSWPVILPLFSDLAALRRRLPKLITTATALAIMFNIVHFNTIVHPFTLADNRHYVFYVFALLRRHWIIKYAVIPVYYICGWLVLTALGGAPESQPDQKTIRILHSADTVSVSDVLVWLLATSLSLVTAPLVEPRYFIVPWLMWRLAVPEHQPQSKAQQKFSQLEKGKSTRGKQDSQSTFVLQTALTTLAGYSAYIELAWYLTINIVTGYIFLYKGFEWPQEPGNVQRFMW
ncbi:hypothetical protein LTR84_012605 [Exophiala bonariae]|uniref:Dol-P-Glc:Glc(2)Man(9)GlcNAc(2)-PP-Dol alpha-1,2-glucosyltransferase n=1 Tax=Exophiala bonariae TaxID=1690606 RepID=A0AAV9NET6_9EURO|nr:hypothetical protein LTR84_012605 [Exophiala bonariae]